MERQNVVVTGGTRGIGGAISKAFYSQGHQVAAIYHESHEKAKTFSTETGIPIFSVDVSDFQSCQAGIESITKAFGGVDILINNAGIIQDAPLHKMTIDQWNSVIVTNLYSVFHMCRCVIDGMRNRRKGTIINISSINAQKGQRGQVNYTAAKAGILGFTKSLAQETAPYNITVNAIAPGYLDTDMVKSVPENILEGIVRTIPMARLGAIEDVAQLALYLAGPSARFITGATFNINGGQLMN